MSDTLAGLATEDHRRRRLTHQPLLEVLLGTIGWQPARWPGSCGSCGLPYDAGAPIRPCTPTWAELGVSGGRLLRPRSWWAACCWDRPVPGVRAGRQKPQVPVAEDPTP